MKRCWPRRARPRHAGVIADASSPSDRSRSLTSSTSRACRSRQSPALVPSESASEAACACAPWPRPSRAITSKDRLGRQTRPASRGDRAGRAAQRSPRPPARSPSRCRPSRRRPETVNHPAQTQVVRTEVMTPLRHAMGLVHGEQAHLAVRQRRQERGGGKALRRAQHDPRAAATDVRQGTSGGPGIHARGDHRGRMPAQHKPPVLIRHQRDQRGDHDRQRIARRSRAAGSTGSCRRR